MNTITPQQCEDDERLEAIYAVAGYGVPSSASQTASAAIAALMNWWQVGLAGATYDPLTDIDDLIKVLQAYRRQARANPGLMLPAILDPTMHTSESDFCGLCQAPRPPDRLLAGPWHETSCDLWWPQDAQP